MNERTPLGNLLYDWRIKNNIYLYDMAKQLDINSAALSRYEHGRATLPGHLPLKLQALCKFNQDEMIIVRHATRENIIEEEQ